jgi:feruloyl-CoA synthase
VRCLFYAAASLSQTLAEALQTIAVETCGERLLLITGLGATETAPMAICRPWDDQRANAIGLPVSGLDLKLLPIGDRFEVRVSGPNVMPGFWRQDELTRDAFDEEGFYRMGDAVRFIAEGDPSQGLVFDGRLAEDFKMSSGTWVHVGPLRARVIAHFSPYIRDAVVTGHGRGELGLLAVPDLEACRTLCPSLAIDAPAAAVLANHFVRARMAILLSQFALTASGSASRIVRLMLLEEPPSLDAQETTDKGSLNQRAILKRRAALVEALHADMPPPSVIVANLERWSPVNAVPRGRVH